MYTLYIYKRKIKQLTNYSHIFLVAVNMTWSSPTHTSCPVAAVAASYSVRDVGREDRVMPKSKKKKSFLERSSAKNYDHSHFGKKRKKSKLGRKLRPANATRYVNRACLQSVCVRESKKERFY
jgi:hypothetical protein